MIFDLYIYEFYTLAKKIIRSENIQNQNTYNELIQSYNGVITFFINDFEATDETEFELYRKLVTKLKVLLYKARNRIVWLNRQN